MAAGPLAAYAQGPGLPLIGYLGPEAPERFASRVNAFRDGLAETGYIEGRNVGIEFRWADGDYQKLPALAADLAARQVAVMVAPGGALMRLLRSWRPQQSRLSLRWVAILSHLGSSLA